MKFEYVLPSSWWTETADSHCLLIGVPGFKKEEVRIRADSNDHVVVSGERQANDNTILHFEQAYKVPEGCNIQETNAILEDETYYVIIPKKLDSINETEEHRAQESISDGIDNATIDETNQNREEIAKKEPISDGIDNATIDETNQNREEIAKKEPSDTSLMKKLMKMVMKKKRCLVFTALMALSLGLLVSHTYQLTPQKEAKRRGEDDDK